MGDMQQEIAYRFAATAVEGVSLDQARKIVDTYRIALASCAACNNTGVDTPTATQCQQCRTTKGQMPLGDKATVEWFCVHNQFDKTCFGAINNPEEDDRDHSECHAKIQLSVTQSELRSGV